MANSSYNPNPSVLFAGPLDTSQTTRATPDAFGANVGQAGERIGQSLAQAGQTAMSVLTEKQQQLNDADVANAETKLNEGIGDVDGWFKSLENREAVNAHPEAVERIKKLRQDISAGLPNDAARRSFNLLAARTEGFTLRDYGNYVGGQIKKADTTATLSLQEQNIENASKWSVATDEAQLGYTLGTVASTAAKLTQTQGWDLNTDEGKAVYNKYLDDQKGKVWENVTKTLAFGDGEHKGDVVAAVDNLQKHKDVIPAATLSKLYQALDAPYRAAQTRNISDEEIRNAEKDWEKSITTKSELPDITPNKTTSAEGPTSWAGLHPGAKDNDLQLEFIRDKFKAQETGGSPEAAKTNPFQIQDGTWKEYARPGEVRGKDDEAVFNRIMTRYSRLYGNDLGRMSVAYFSGPGNVAGAGSATPWKEDKQDKSGKKTSEYVSDMLGRVGSQPTESGTAPLQQNSNLPIYRTKAEYLSINQDKILQKVEERAQRDFPNDLAVRDQAVSRATQYINRIQTVEREKQYADNEAVYRFIFGDDGKTLVSDVGEIENGPPEIRDAWNRMDSLKQQAIQTRLLTANTKGRQSTYGTQFWEKFNDMVDGKIANVSDLYKDVGPDKNSVLTNTGLSMIAKEMSIGQNALGVKDPQGQAFLQSEKAYFAKLRTDIVGGLSRHNANGERVFQQAVMQALPKIQAARAHGAGGEMFDPDSKNYPGGSEVYEYRPLATRLNDMIDISNPMTMGSLLPPESAVTPALTNRFDKITDPAEGQKTMLQFFKDRAAAGQEMTQKEYDLLHDYAVKRGWYSGNSQPSVPGAR